MCIVLVLKRVSSLLCACATIDTKLYLNLNKFSIKYTTKCNCYFLYDHIGYIKMISMLTLSAVDLGFEPWLGQNKDYKIGICCFSAKNAALRRKSKDWLAWHREWGDMSIWGLFFQWASTMNIQLSVLV